MIPIFSGMKQLIRHPLFMLSHFILAMFLISCNIHRASSGNINISGGADKLYFKNCPKFNKNHNHLGREVALCR
jgi:hypothetical protein